MASVVNWGSSDYFRYYAGGWSSWSTAPATGGYLNRYGTRATNYKVLGSCTVTPSSGKKLTQFSVTTKVYNQAESATSVTWYCYLTTTTPFLQNGTYIAPTSRPSYSYSASVTATPSSNGTNIKFTFTGLNVTSATNFYMIFEQSSDKYYSLGGGGFAYSVADMREVSSSSVTFRPNGGTCTFNGTSYSADSSALTLWQGQAYSIGTPSWSGHRFLGWTQYSGTVVFSKAHTTSGLSDPGFYSGQNNVVYYNNSGGSWTCSRVADSGTYRGYYGNYRLDITLPNVTSTPGHGGWRQNPGGFAANNTYAYMARAYIPTAQTLYIANNSLGRGGASSWYTRQTGAGAYVNYGYQLKLGTSPHGGAGFYTYLSGGSKPISIHINCVTGYNITNGWSMNATPTSGSLVILGVWNYNNYTVTYNANSGNSTPSAQTKYHDQALTLAAAITRNNSGNSNSFTVKYDKNGGTSTPSQQTNTKYTSYAFGGWNTNNSGTGTNYSASGSYTANASVTLYAKWNSTVHQNAITLAAAISHNSDTVSRTVSFNANGGTCSTSSLTSNATRTWAFNGWHSGSASGTKYSAGQSYTPSANVTMFAGWNTTIGQYGEITLPTPTRVGYSFKGWYTASSGGTKIGNAGAKWRPDTNRTLYAQWTVNTYTVSYALGGGTQAHTNGQRVSSGNYTYVYNPTTVAYDMSNFAALDSSHPVNGFMAVDRPTRTGYTFSHWVISGMDSTTHGYWGSSNAEITFTSTSLNTSSTTPVNPTTWRHLRATAGTVTFTAHWTANNYTITLNKNGGAGGTDSVSIAYNTAKGSYPSITLPTRTGYTFNGYWDTSAASGGTEWYDANGNSLRTFNLTANTTWYARWTKIQSIVKYYPNGGTVAPQAGGTATTTTQNYSYEYGTNQTAPTPTRTGYTFLRWSRQMNGTSEAFNYGRSMMAATLRYRIYAYRDDWSDIGTERIISCTESGGWNIENNNGNIIFAVYSEGDNAYRNANSTTTWASLSAGWHCFEFVFNGTNAKGYLDGTLIATSANFTVPSGQSTGRIKYHATNDLFVGDEATGAQNGHAGTQYWSGKLGFFYVDGTTSGPIGPTTNPNAFRVYASTSGWTYSAEWEEITAILSFNMVGGSGGPSAITMKYTTATTIPATSTWPTRTGYTCIGWATSEARAKNGDVDYMAGDVYKAANVVPTAATLYAVWRSTITYNANNGTGAPSPDYMYYTPAFNLSTTKPTRIGYKFKYWDTAADDSGVVKFSAGAQFKSANEWKSNITLYAIWEPYGIIRIPPSLTPSNITTNSNNSIIVNGLTFLLTIPYIYKNGSWQQHQPFGYDNGEWKVGE